MDMQELDLPANEFDGIWASFSLLHVHKNDASRVLDNFQRVLRPQGCLLVALHRGPKTSWVEANISGMDKICRVQEWVPTEFEELLSQTGFKVIYSRSFEREGGRFPLLSIMATS